MRSFRFLLLPAFAIFLLLVTKCNDSEEIISISIDPAMINITAGETIQLTAVTVPSNPTVLDYIWKSSDEKIATVNSTGVLTALSSGVVTITLTTKDERQSGSSIVTVNPDLSPDIYVTGYADRGTGQDFIAKYWKNGKEIALTDGTKSSYATSVYVTTNDIHVAGFEMNSSLKYWKNNSVVPITSVSSKAYDVFVSGSDLYLAGEQWGGQGSIATYWKNGVPVHLTDGTKLENASSIFVSGSDVYVAGNEQGFGPGSNSIAKYWKNGTPIKLTDGTKRAYVRSIYVHDNDVYVAGSEYNDDEKEVAKYWKNGIAIELSDGKISNSASSILISNNDVYVAGSGEAAKYWKNGIETKLTKTYADANSIVVFKGDVFVAGNERINGIAVAKYWKNNKEIILSNESKSNYATCIFVKEK